MNAKFNVSRNEAIICCCNNFVYHLTKVGENDNIWFEKFDNNYTGLYETMFIPIKLT